MDWRIVSFSDSEGVIIEYMATQRDISYFAPEHSAKIVLEDLYSDDAFDIEGIMNSALKFKQLNN